MPVPDKNPPPLTRSRRRGEIGYYVPASAVQRGDKRYPRKHSAWWLVLFALVWVVLILFIIYVFS